mmetsp:Transcript_51915/g.105702  ORF Transcript_51915/g.105702 Transcript_51915/m.105702 type:complete len:214 (+) Transcript_51915:136-777(+)
MDAAGAGRLYQGHCSGCSVLLMFPSGSSAVECARCGAVTSQGRCTGCGVTLMYPPGSPSVECAICGTVSQFGTLASNAAGEAGYMAYLSCGGCRTQLMYPRTAESVKCAICHYITPTAVPLDSSKNMVVIQNPDGHGSDAFVVGYVPGSSEAVAAQRHDGRGDGPPQGEEAAAIAQAAGDGALAVPEVASEGATGVDVPMAAEGGEGLPGGGA